MPECLNWLTDTLVIACMELITLLTCSTEAHALPRNGAMLRNPASELSHLCDVLVWQLPPCHKVCQLGAGEVEEVCVERAARAECP